MKQLRCHPRPLVLAFALLAATACRLDSRDDYLGDKDPKQFGLGQPASAAMIAAENIDVSPDGAGLPPGSGTAARGAVVYAGQCAACHGAKGEGRPPYPQLIGGPKNVDFSSDAHIPRTIGNYWPYATTLYGYIRRAMPLPAPGSLSSNDTYAVVAFLLASDSVISADATMDARSLPQVQMPERSHFVWDDRRGSQGGKTVR
jgi:cytochrome c